MASEVYQIDNADLVRVVAPAGPDGKPRYRDFKWPGSGQLIVKDSANGVVVSGPPTDGLAAFAPFAGSDVRISNLEISARPTAAPGNADPAKALSITILSFTVDTPTTAQASATTTTATK